MKELTVYEMNEVSGAGLRQVLAGTQTGWNAIVDTVMGAVIGGFAASGFGGLQGGVTGNGIGGGVLGFGVITTGIGSIWGAIQGAVSGVVWGAYEGAAVMDIIVEDGINAIFNGTMGGWVPQNSWL